jgi:hypothetical protein
LLLPVNKRRLRILKWLLAALAILGLAIYQYYQFERAPVVGGADSARNPVLAAYAAQQSGLWLETSGRIQRVLHDDNDGARHQRFVLELDGGHTVLVAHNIDLARRIPARQGLTLGVRGRYEWNNHGGVIHWTHHDPQGREPGGWISIDGTRYE